MSCRAIVFALAPVALLAACGDTTSSVGDEGKLRYSLYTTYDVPEGELRDARIITGHQQRIDVSLTLDGRDDVDDPDELVHSLEPKAGVSIESVDAGRDQPTGIRVTVTSPGSYVLESMIDDELVDKITLQFEKPGGFELLVRARGPWQEDFREVGGNPATLEEGTQVTILPIPTDAGGARLAGDMTTEVSVTPEWAVVPDLDIYGSYEQGVWTGSGDLQFYLIEPASVTFLVSDPVSGATGAQQVEVTPVDQS